jgi:hypothetical protein
VQQGKFLFSPYKEFFKKSIRENPEFFMVYSLPDTGKNPMPPAKPEA